MAVSRQTNTDHGEGLRSAFGAVSYIDHRPISARQGITILLCGLVMLFDGFDTQSISFMTPYIARDWHLPRAVLGPIFSASLVGLMAGYLLLSPLSDRFGHKRMIAYSTLGFALMTLASVLVRDVSSLMILRVLTGVGLGGAIPSAVALTGEYSPRRFRASLVLAIYCGFSLGFVVAGVAAGWLISSFGWRSMFYAGAVLPLIVTPLLFAFLPEATAARPKSRSDVGAESSPLRNPSLAENDLLDTASSSKGSADTPLRCLFAGGMAYGTLLLWFVFLINLGEFYAVQSWLPTILTGFHYPMHIVVAATNLVPIGGIVAAFIVGPAMDRINPYHALVVLYAAGFVFTAMVGAAFQTSIPILLGATFLSGICISGGQKSVIALGAVFYPDEIRSTGIGWALGIGRLGGIFSPLIVGAALAEGLEPRKVFYLLASPMLAMAAAIMLMGRQYNRMIGS
jgi:MFS transporter, AAHS family, 4-hydroxybenzoate transporter